mgnify:CR=1 FL=1
MILIPLFATALLLFLYQALNKFKVGVVSYLIFVYFCSIVCSLVLYLFFDYSESYILEFEPIFYFSSGLCVLLIGFFRFRDYRLKKVVLNNIRLIKFIELAIIPFTIGAIVFFMLHALTVLSGDIEANRYAVVAGEENYLGGMGVINSIFSLVANLFLLNMLYSFLNLTESYPGASTGKAFMHLMLSTVYIFYIMAYVGRDGVVFWGMSLIFFYLLFKDFIVEGNRRYLRRSAMVLAVPAVSMFMMISIYRFGGGGAGHVVLALLDYAGQQLLNFNDHYLVDAPLAHGAISFAPIVTFESYFLGADSLHFDKDAWNQVFLDKGVMPWVFTTLIGSFMYDFGRAGGFGVVVFLSGFVYCILRDVKRHGFIKFSDLILFVLVFQIVSWGVFYYRQYSSFFYILSLLALAGVSKLSGGASKVILSKVGCADE